MTPENKNINGAGLEHFSSIIKDELAGKQDSLTAGTNITIDENNVISATGGGGSDYTFTDGLTEENGTVSWDLNDRMKAGTGKNCVVTGWKNANIPAYTYSLVNVSGNVSTTNLNGASNLLNLAGNNVKVKGRGLIASVNDSNISSQTSLDFPSIFVGSGLIVGQNQDAYGGNAVFGNGLTLIGEKFCSIMAGGSERGEPSYSVMNAGYAASFGKNLKTSTDCQTVIGNSNIEDTNHQYVFIIGNGNANSNRSNALTVDWAGNLTCNNIPAPPSSDGSYNLHLDIVNGVPTYTWKAEPANRDEVSY